jgi:uncharacterized protein
MRRLAAACLALLLAAPLWAGLPKGLPSEPADPVTDLAGMLDAGTVATLNAELRRVHDAGGFQLVVLTLPTLDGQAIEDVGVAVGRAWGLGDKARGDGVLLLVAPQEHRLRIEVGSRLEGQLTDIACARIIREEMTPRLKAGDPNGAVLAGCQAIAQTLGVTLSLPDAPAAPAEASDPGFAVVFVIFLVIFVVVRALTGRGMGGGFGGGLGGGMGGFGGGGFGGGGGGGFGGGGGGFSGGGASGGW